MDFRDELQNLVNRYPGIVKSVKVKFVENIEVKPNGEKPVTQKVVLPHTAAEAAMAAVVNAKPALTDLDFQMTETRFNEPLKTNLSKKSKDSAALKATMAALNSPVI